MEACHLVERVTTASPNYHFRKEKNNICHYVFLVFRNVLKQKENVSGALGVLKCR